MSRNGRGKTSPGNDVQHQNQENAYVNTYNDCFHLGGNWGNIQAGDDLIISGHGRQVDPSVIDGRDAAGTLHVLDYNGLANAVATGVNNPGLALQIKLYVCFAADMKVRPGDAPSGIEIFGKRFFERKYCFAGQFFSAIKNMGYTKVKVAGYHGGLYWDQVGEHKVVCTRNIDPDNLRDHNPHGLGVLLVNKRAYGAARHRREWFTDNFLGTRWL